MVCFLHRDRVMEARFDGFILQLRIQARAIDGVMFRREAWDALSGMEKEPSCQDYALRPTELRSNSGTPHAAE